MDVEAIIREHIRKTVHLSLATVNGDTPWVCEVHFAYDEDLNLYWRSTAARRHSQEIANNPKVAGNIVREHALEEEVVGLYFEGTAVMITDVEEQKKIAPLFESQLAKNQSDIVAEAATDDGHKFYKVSVANWYAFGRFGAERGQKLKLEWNGGSK